MASVAPFGAGPSSVTQLRGSRLHFSRRRSLYFFGAAAPESLARFPAVDGEGPSSLARRRRFLARFLACARLRAFSRALSFGIANSMLF